MNKHQSSGSTRRAPRRVILAGADERLVPLYERLRGNDRTEVVALGSMAQDSLTELLALIANIPLLEESGALPQAELWVCDEEWRERATDSECIDFAQADGLWPQAESSEEEAAEKRPLQSIARGSVPVALAASTGADFPRELQREIQRSKRYHLGFTLSIFRVLDAAGQALPESGFHEEPLKSFPARQGRACDSWGLSREGFLLHLAPETLEQAPSMRRRLNQALELELAKLTGGPWRLFTAQVRFPQDSESARDLLGLALQRLERKLGDGAADAGGGD